MSKTPQESAVEKIKKASRGLRGTIVESLADEHTGAIREDDQNLIKFHGMYIQDDRDRREERATKKLERLYSFMIRLRLAGGFLTAEQWEGLHHIAGDYSTGIIKITTRQTVQLHGIVKSNIKPTLQAFNRYQLDSICTCGDVNRNVTATAHPQVSPVHGEVFQLANDISTLLLPKTRAYYEIWLDEAPLTTPEPEPDPLYENRYLPRKFKIGIAIPPSNDIDVYTNDIALVAIVEKGKIKGFNLAIGGGMGTTHGSTETYPRLATTIGFIPYKALKNPLKETEISTVLETNPLLKAVYEVLTVQRDFGNRVDRKLSRLKYTVDKLGVEGFKAELEKRIGFKLEPAKPVNFTHRTDDYGWHQNHEGNWFYTVFVENGRVLDDENVQFKTACLTIAQARKANFRFSCNQNLILSDIKTEDKAWIESVLAKHGISQHTDNASVVRKSAIACVSFNTCPLALAEGQRYLPDLITKIEPVLAKHKLQKEDISIRMTGCPNGCARPYAAEIGFVGTHYGRYNLMLGAKPDGTRLNRLYKESLNETEILGELDNLFAQYVKQRKSKESFGDFVQRTVFEG
ncbi:NADPH-dependent assimilatory sulfite reductase hemoprotein subunit [Beggiatoa leptomitoformis]|uniref:assimilatory sulfite reductase (NADPH) n=1 Tax=Beggiatoa leptomitoformis TaxID=288004 RepID=A0A2N9YDA3_9GAMM|nr:NADPH-dependent assimilatory sulfite reductase hemoprotein subunit [Beggiatoa leptomitoformis]ALG69125.1 NADPH-dependent assimilatory sulfite reductase hemoprotein subunit [Beggiatoa leptomitoformis]AUI68460.1 NADPH-dependent assimilatory sulfite reductase hemoprotein subunit [Beggiatoa leptomitoformis]